MSMKEVQDKVSKIKPNLYDRWVEWRDPERALRRRKARVSLALSGGYKGASKSRRATKTMVTNDSDADGDSLDDLPTLRNRSSDLVRNNPIATGVMNTKVANVVGTGLRLHSSIDSDFLGLTKEQASDWEESTEREFRMWAESTDCDVARTLNFYAQQELVFLSALERGDSFALMPFIERKNSPYSLAIQIIEADRVCNENNSKDTEALAGGIRKDKNGAPVEYHIANRHPGSYNRTALKWTKIKAYGANSGRKNILHLFRKRRPGQTRGIPDLAPVIEALKQLGEYTDAELMAAVVSGMFTVFVHTEGDFSLEEIADYNEKYGPSDDGELKMGSGSVVNLGPNERVSSENPGRPNQAFDPFVASILKQIGVALELPFDLLVQQFNSSYSASKAAIEQAFIFFRSRRKWLGDNFCQEIYAAWMYEAVAKGRVVAPGFMRDPAIRAAYLGADWVGPTKPVLDLVKETNGRAMMEDRGWITAAENTVEMTGGDWDRKHRQRAKEHQKRVEADLEPKITTVEVEKSDDDD